MAPEVRCPKCDKVNEHDDNGRCSKCGAPIVMKKTTYTSDPNFAPAIVDDNGSVVEPPKKEPSPEEIAQVKKHLQLA
jgi:hypothetical protein